MTEKTWGRGCVTFGERKNNERNGETPLRTVKYFNFRGSYTKQKCFMGCEKFLRIETFFSVFEFVTREKIKISQIPQKREG